MRIQLVMTEFDSSQYCEPDIYMDVDTVFDSEEKAKQYINDTLVAELIEEECNRIGLMTVQYVGIVLVSRS